MIPKFPSQPVNFLLNEGGLGDNVARLPVIKYIAEKYPHVIPIVWIPDYFHPVAENCLPGIDFRKFSDNQLYDESLPARSTGARWFTNLKTHMVTHAFCLLANEIPEDPKHYNYCKINLNPISVNKFNLPKKFVVITCGFTAPIREFLPEYVNQVAKYCISKGYKIVFLGKKQTHDGANHTIKGTFKDEIDFAKGLNLIDKTSLLEAAKIMSKAQVVLGLDNGLLNLAACTDVKILGGFTSVDPQHRLPYREGIKGHNFHVVAPPLDQKERFMQSLWDFCFDVDFTKSYYNNDSLIKSLSAELYIRELAHLLI